MRLVMIMCALAAASAVDARPQKSDSWTEAQRASDAKANEARGIKSRTGPAADATPPEKKSDEAGRAMGDIVSAPLEDVNIKTRRIPEVLELARGGPYEIAGLRTCGAIGRDIAALNTVLGTDFDTPEDRRPNRGRQAASVGKAVVQSFIPFRGVIREVSGAAAAQREWDAAVDAGIARRGFLRGVARMRGCRVAA